MNTESAFLQAIREAPDDDAPRLIYADWLEEHGVPGGAERAKLIPDLTVLRELEIDDDTTAEGWADKAFGRLVAVLDRLPLCVFDLHASIGTLDTVQLLGTAPALRGLSTLKIRVEGDEAVAILAASPHLAGLRSLELEACKVFTDQAFQAILEFADVRRAGALLVEAREWSYADQRGGVAPLQGEVRG